jgi:RNA polymerase sigma factor (sigma-70 family)
MRDGGRFLSRGLLPVPASVRGSLIWAKRVLVPEGSGAEAMSEEERIDSWVRQAQAGDAEAYRRIVQKLQDLAVGCAVSVLGDFHLAEDAAQEAFVEAWRNLPKLREPAAFAGWLRMILFKHCDRLTRGKRLPTVPLELAGEVPARHSDPADVAERRALRESVRREIRALPEPERIVTMLFYIGEYSQQEIADFAGISVVPVKKRLAAARKRLQERTLALMQEELHAHRPSRDDGFTRRVMAFTREFSALLLEGQISLQQVLADLARDQDDEQFQTVLEQVRNEVLEGQPLSRAMARYPRYFDDRYVRAVRLGEVTGTLDLQLQRLAAGDRFDCDEADDPNRASDEAPGSA